MFVHALIHSSSPWFIIYPNEHVSYRNHRFDLSHGNMNDMVKFSTYSSCNNHDLKAKIHSRPPPPFETVPPYPQISHCTIEVNISITILLKIWSKHFLGVVYFFWCRKGQVLCPWNWAWGVWHDPSISHTPTFILFSCSMCLGNIQGFPLGSKEWRAEKLWKNISPWNSPN